MVFSPLCICRNSNAKELIEHVFYTCKTASRIWHKFGHIRQALDYTTFPPREKSLLASILVLSTPKVNIPQRFLFQHCE